MNQEEIREDSIDEIVQAWRREEPSVNPESIGVVSRVWHLAKLFGDDRRRLLAASNIDPAILDLLSVLQRSGPPYRLSTREIAARSLVTPGAISQRLGRAGKAGLIERETARDGSRTVFVSLTGLGHETVTRYVQVVLDREATLLEGLSRDEQQLLADLLRVLLHHVSSRVESSPRTQVGV